MANDKNVPASKTVGIVTHKMLINTSEGVFAISLFSNNDLHQHFAKAFCDGDDDSDLLVSLITGAKIVKNEEAPSDDSRLQRLLALKAAAASAP